MKKAIFDRYANAIAKEFNLTLEEMFSTSRKQHLVEARQMLYYLCRERPMRISSIQTYLKDNGLDIHHSTIIHGNKKAKELIKSDPDYSNLSERISRV
jgi:chromosomal replication initiation ATPase DnaA|tara:strand:- start:15789 stop:16082 length:294 start_codon:yes stop_codon:yes gene_type:complete